MARENWDEPGISQALFEKRRKFQETAIKRAFEVITETEREAQTWYGLEVKAGVTRDQLITLFDKYPWSDEWDTDDNLYLPGARKHNFNRFYDDVRELALELIRIKHWGEITAREEKLEKDLSGMKARLKQMTELASGLTDMLKRQKNLLQFLIMDRCEKGVSAARLGLDINFNMGRGVFPERMRPLTSEQVTRLRELDQPERGPTMGEIRKPRL